MDLHIRTLRPPEMRLAIDFAALEGWNPGLHDGACFLAADPEGFLSHAAGSDLAPGTNLGFAKQQAIFDIFNAFNARPVLAVNTRYAGADGGAWLRPTSTLVGRLVKFGVQVDF